MSILCLLGHKWVKGSYCILYCLRCDAIKRHTLEPQKDPIGQVITEKDWYSPRQKKK